MKLNYICLLAAGMININAVAMDSKPSQPNAAPQMPRTQAQVPPQTFVRNYGVSGVAIVPVSSPQAQRDIVNVLAMNSDNMNLLIQAFFAQNREILRLFNNVVNHMAHAQNTMLAQTRNASRRGNTHYHSPKTHKDADGCKNTKKPKKK